MGIDNHWRLRQRDTMMKGILFIFFAIHFKDSIASPYKLNDIYNTPCHYYRSSENALEPKKYSHIIQDKTPETDLEINRYVLNHNLQHGDLVNFDEYRESATKIVYFDPSSTMYRFISNPDESGSGYLTIPKEILKDVTDFKSKYAEVLNYIEDNYEVINFHVSPSDDFITKKFGFSPKGYEFDVYLQGKDIIEVFAVRKGVQNWEEFDYDYERVTWKQIVEFFKANAQEKTSFSVKVTLNEEDMKVYKNKYGGQFTYDWMKAQPTLPVGWKLERGATTMSTNHIEWNWRFIGPEKTTSQAKSSVKKFLDGFKYKFM